MQDHTQLPLEDVISTIGSLSKIAAPGPDGVTTKCLEYGGLAIYSKEEFEGLKTKKVEIVKFGDVETSEDEEEK